MIRKILSIVLALTMMATQAFAITGVPDSTHWVAAGFGGAGTYSMIVPDNFVQNKIYAIPDVNSPYVTTDKGELWSYLSTAGAANSGFTPTQVAAFTQSKNNPLLMYAVDSANGGLVRSVDGGNTWVKLTSYKGTKGQKTIVINPTDDDIVYVASVGNGTVKGGRVYRTIDGGNNWSEYFRPFDIAIVAESAELNGSTNTRTGRLNSLTNILPGSVVFTSSGGETFTDNGAGVLVSNMGGSGTITYSNVNSSSYGNYSLTFGTTPSTTTVDYTISASASFITMDSSGQYIFAGRDASSSNPTFVRYTISGGTLTTITLTGTNATRVADWGSYVDGSSVEHLCFTAGWKIACTDNNGGSFTYTAAISSDSTHYINHFAVRRKADNSINFVVNRRTTSSSFATALHRSNDGGSTWASGSTSNNTTMNPTGKFTAGSPNIFSLAADPFNEDVWYLSSDWRIWRSDNNGQTFSEKDTGAQNTVAHDVKVAPNGRVFQASMDTGIQYSDDYGVTWSQGTPDSSKGQPFVTGSVNDYGGHYWQIELAGDESAWNSGAGKAFVCATMYSSPTSLYYVNYLVRSLDSGANYTRSNSGLPIVALYGDAVWGQGYCRAMGLSADETKLYIGMDGENCDGDGPGGNPYNCSTNMATGGLFKSTDDGATFSTVWASPRKVFNALAVDPKDTTGEILLFGTFGYNLYRKTGAATANYVGDSFGPGATIVDVAYDINGRPYAAVSNSGPKIYKSVVTQYGNGTGMWGTWRLMHSFGSDGMLDGIVIDKNNPNRIFVSVTEGSSPASRRIYVTTDAQNAELSTWYDITGDFPVAGGCRALDIHPDEGTQGYLYCAANGGNIWKLNLADTPAVETGVMKIGVSND